MRCALHHASKMRAKDRCVSRKRSSQLTKAIPRLASCACQTISAAIPSRIVTLQTRKFDYWLSCNFLYDALALVPGRIGVINQPSHMFTFLAAIHDQLDPFANVSIQTTESSVYNKNGDEHKLRE